MLLGLRSWYHYFVGDRHVLLFCYKHQQYSLGNAHGRIEEYIKKFLFSICDILRYFLKNGRPIPSIGDTHASTPMLLVLSLDNKWSTVNVSAKKFWLSRVHRTLSVVCEVVETASASTGIIGIWCYRYMMSHIQWTKFSFEHFLKIELNWLGTKDFIGVSLERFISWDLSVERGPPDYESTVWAGILAFSGFWLSFPSFNGKNPVIIQ